MKYHEKTSFCERIRPDSFVVSSVPRGGGVHNISLCLEYATLLFLFRHLTLPKPRLLRIPYLWLESGRLRIMPQYYPHIYEYDPSLPAAVFAAAIFCIVTLLHTYQLLRSRTWFFIPFVLGGYCEFQVDCGRCKGLIEVVEFLGYIVRATSIEQSPKYTLGPYVAGLVLILVAPTLFAASIYMALGRLLTVMQADKHSLVRTSWLTKIFIFGDVASFVTQGVGAVVISNQTTDDMSRGANIITIGLAVQILFFLWFIITSVVFYWRTNWQPTDRSRNPGIPWK